jgi:hypothetical protein
MKRTLSLMMLATASVVLAGTVACQAEAPPEKAAPVQVSPPLAAGSYEVQSISYDDADGAYRVFLVNPPPGAKPIFVAVDLPMARLTDDDIKAGKATARLDVDQPGPVVPAVPAEGAAPVAAPVAVEGAAAPAADAAVAAVAAVGPVVAGPVVRLPQDFAVQYTHNVVEERGGQQVVVRQESSTWSPFMGVMTGMMVGNMLFGPRYYYPPPYMAGGMSGVGGAGLSRQAAASSYTQQHGKAPQSARLSSSGYAKAPSSSLKATGSGAGSTRMKSPGTSTGSSKRSFGGGGFGRRRR